jgi:hypothetical protein
MDKFMAKKATYAIILVGGEGVPGKIGVLA